MDGPILFLIYINFVVDGLSSKCCMFADDLKLYLAMPHKYSSRSVAHDLLQSDINLLFSRSKSWGLTFSPSKCHVMHFHRNFNTYIEPLQYHIDGVQINQVECQRDLGVLIDRNMRFHSHVSSIVNKASGVACNILKSTCCRSSDFMLTIFTTHIRPILDFCSPVWNLGYEGNLKLLERVQRRWTKQIIGLNNLPYDERLSSLNLFSIRGRLLRADLIQIWKITHDSVGNNLRGHSLKLFHPRCDTDTRQRFFPMRCISVWNSLPEEVVMADNLKSFKNLLHRNMRDSFFYF